MHRSYKHINLRAEAGGEELAVAKRTEDGKKCTGYTPDPPSAEICPAMEQKKFCEESSLI